MAKAKKSPVVEHVSIPVLKMEVVKIPIQGLDGPLVVHNWSEKAIMDILAKQMHIKIAVREAKDPEAHYKSSLYVATTGVYGFPATAFKSAMVRAAKPVDGLEMTAVRQMVFVVADCHENRTFKVPLGDKTFTHRVNTPLVKIYGKPQMRMDMVRLTKGGSCDVRFRAEFVEWSAILTIRYHADRISAAEVANLVNIGGNTVGAGEGRPEKGADMTWGRYEVKAKKATRRKGAK